MSQKKKRVFDCGFIKGDEMRMRYKVQSRWKLCMCLMRNYGCQYKNNDDV